MSNKLKFTGRITRVDEVVSGISNAGNAWQKRSFKVEEDEGEYPTTVYFVLFGKKVDDINVESKMGELVDVSFNISAREWSSQDGTARQSTDLMAWKVESAE